MNFKNCRILWVYFFYFLQTLLFGQEENLEEQPPPGVELKTNSLEQDQRQIAGAETNGPESERISTIFYIRTVDFEVKGRGYTHSRTFALLRQGDFKAGEQISGKEGLKEYIINKTQLLLNHRVLESVEIDYTQGEAEAEGVPIDLLVKVVDTWNIIALPYPKFDSNSGFELILKARDYNFLGTMVPLRLDLGYAYKEGEEQVSPAQHVFKVEIDSDIPFEGFGLNWNINFDHLFSYTLEDGDGFISYKNITGLSVEFPIKRTSLTVSFEENFILNEENPVRYKAEYGDFAPFYMSSQLKGSWKMPLGLRVAQFGELTYTPEVSGKIPYRIGGELEPWRKGPALTLSHRLGFGQINWIGNYRSGLEASLKNENTYNFYRQGWENNYGLSVTGHIIAARFLGVSSRFQFQQWFFDKTFSENRYPDHVQAGGALRGILDRTVIAKHGGFMISLNLDFPFQVLRFVPSKWFNNKKLRFFDFDMHISPFIDMALVHGSRVKWGDADSVAEENPIPFIPFSYQGMLTGAGLEIIVFPGFMRSFYLRASFGYNMNEFMQNLRPTRLYGDELFFGIGHHY